MGKLTDAEHGSITQGILRADYTFRHMSPEDAKQAGRYHRESIARALTGLADPNKDRPRSVADRVAMGAADFIAHLHDDLPLGPPSELGIDNPTGLIERSEAEHYRLAAIGKAVIDSFLADQLS